MEPGTEYGEPTFADVTGDGWEEAIFLEGWYSGGTAWSSFVSVYSMLPGDAAPRRIHFFSADERYLQYSGDTRLGVESASGNGLVLSRDIFTEDDPMCCPSVRRIETWRWNGRTFVEDVSQLRRERIPMETYRGGD